MKCPLLSLILWKMWHVLSSYLKMNPVLYIAYNNLRWSVCINTRNSASTKCQKSRVLMIIYSVINSFTIYQTSALIGAGCTTGNLEASGKQANQIVMFHLEFDFHLIGIYMITISELKNVIIDYGSWCNRLLCYENAVEINWERQCKNLERARTKHAKVNP